MCREATSIELGRAGRCMAGAPTTRASASWRRTARPSHILLPAISPDEWKPR